MDSAISLSERNIFVKQFDFENTKLLKSYRHVPWIESLADVIYREKREVDVR